MPSWFLISIFFVSHPDNQRTLWNRSKRATLCGWPKAHQTQLPLCLIKSWSGSKGWDNGTCCWLWYWSYMQMVGQPYQSLLTCFMMLVMVVMKIMLISKQVKRDTEILDFGTKLYVWQTISSLICRLLMKYCGKYLLRQMLYIAQQWKQIYISCHWQCQLDSLGIVAGSGGNNSSWDCLIEMFFPVQCPTTAHVEIKYDYMSNIIVVVVCRTCCWVEIKGSNYGTAHFKMQ